jgi:hypothetical protein
MPSGGPTRARAGRPAWPSSGSAGIREIPKESAVFRRERLAGVGVVPYVMSKVLVLSLLVIAQSATLLAVVGRHVNLPASGVLLDGTWELYVTTTLTALAGLSLGLAISCAGRSWEASRWGA